MAFQANSIQSRIFCLGGGGTFVPPRITLRVTSGDYVREGLFLPVSFTGINGLFDSVNNNFQLELTMPQTECKTNMQS